MDEFTESRRQIESEIEGLQQGGPAEREHKFMLLKAKLSYYQIVMNEALIRSLDNAAREVNHLKQSLASNIRDVNETSGQLNESINLASEEVSGFKVSLINSNEKLSSTQSKIQWIAIGISLLICLATGLIVAFTGWSAYETRTANSLQRDNQARELKSKYEYETIVQENLIEEIDTNLSLIEEIKKHRLSVVNKYLTTGRFHAYYLEKVKDLPVEKEIRIKAIDILNDIEQGNRLFNALMNVQYRDYYDTNLTLFKNFVDITKTKLLDLKEVLRNKSV